MGADLSRIPLFTILPAQELVALGATAELQSFRKGQVIFKENDPADAVWIVRDGWVILSKGSPENPATIFIMTPDEAICGVSAFDRGTYSASAVAATASQVLRIPAESFGRLLDRSPEFSKEVLRTCCVRMRHMAEAISLAHEPVEKRIAYFLLRLRSTFGDTLPLSHGELARLAGMRLETSIRTLAVFQRKKWLAISRRCMKIRSPQPLRDLLSADVPPAKKRASARAQTANGAHRSGELTD